MSLFEDVSFRQGMLLGMRYQRRPRTASGMAYLDRIELSWPMHDGSHHYDAFDYHDDDWSSYFALIHTRRGRTLGRNIYRRMVLAGCRKRR